jgi:hypothetical protein
MCEELSILVEALLPDWVPTMALNDENEYVAIPLVDRIRLMREQYEIDIADLKQDTTTCYLSGLEAGAQAVEHELGLSRSVLADRIRAIGDSMRSEGGKK